MTVKKPVPCSIYDIPGMQEWLDEMALQGLFLVEFDRRCERATFRMGDPKPVRYRLDPMSKNKKQDLEREEPYAEMGWTFVDRIFRHFYVFSCDDPQAPELYTDPQSLAFALNDLMRREVRNNIILTLFLLFALFAVLIDPHGYLRDLILWERPRYLVSYVVYPVLVALCLPLLFLEVKRTLKIRDTLAQGLPLKAKRRWNRPRFLTVYIPTYILIWALPRLLLPDIAWQVYDLDNAETVRPWPTFYQTEAAGPHPLEGEPEVQGYIKSNHSPLAPIQESYSVHWEALTSYDEERIPPRLYSLQMYVEYVQVSSPKIARRAFQIEWDDIVQILETSEKSNITGLTGFTAREYPGLDRLETAQYSQYGQDGWAIVAQRGRDILMVKYVGFARWEDCLPLFLEALDQKEANL